MHNEKRPANRRGAFPGAGDGNRTHVTTLEEWHSTIELHPRYHGFWKKMRPSCLMDFDFKPNSFRNAINNG